MTGGMTGAGDICGGEISRQSAIYSNIYVTIYGKQAPRIALSCNPAVVITDSTNKTFTEQISQKGKS